MNNELPATGLIMTLLSIWLFPVGAIIAVTTKLLAMSAAYRYSDRHS